MVPRPNRVKTDIFGQSDHWSADAMGPRAGVTHARRYVARLIGGIVATTRSRPPRGREQARHASGGVAAEHTGKIYAVAITGGVIILAFLTLTSTGHLVDAAVQHFMLYYAGVFALITLCASVGLGLVATDRVVLRPGHRVFLQSAHRAVSFGAVAFLFVHILTEILAQRVHVLD